MNVRNKIWEELKQAYANALCISKYTNRQRRWNRLYHVFIATAAALGTILTKVEPEWAPITLWVIAFVSIIKSIFPQILQAEQELCRLDDMMNYYNVYMVRMEELFYKYDKGIMTEDQIAEALFDQKKDECPKQSEFNKYLRNIRRREQRKIDQQATTYINEVYYNKYPEIDENA